MFKLGPVIALSILSVGMAVAQDDVAAPTEEETRTERLGWTLPPLPPEKGEPLGELDRLSQSASGISFGVDLYDARKDNPLKPVSVTIRALDKITATFTDIQIPIGEEAQYGPLTLLPRTCDKRPPEETPETTVFLEVYSTKDDVQGERARAREGEATPVARSSIRMADEKSAPRPALFRGWMFASSPSLNALQHPVYDVWVIDCKMVEPGI
ncbi:DUF2155 domain-containing protein [Parvularcula sp. LCG005]|uniref:DUF2155 domain-containing protein n=1 Tax=Parvularcula sp. LCG005 TaxID=3078805 RepID=UPI00294295DA|nr:DUF2155 domain-containing protein [Parvularcula sp. LCG005]WOI54584.1 DUF2155 domain-containing protein [Parvularcula sp. LCG005]